MPSKPDTWRYTTKILGDVAPDRAIASLQDHKFFLETDPNLASWDAVDAPRDGSALHALPAEVTSRLDGDAQTRCYEVTDRVPAGVALFSKVLGGSGTASVSYQITDVRDGMFVFLKAPLGVVQERRWAVEGAGQGGEGLRIVEYVNISCSRLLFGSVKAQQDLHWKRIHGEYVKVMGGEVGEQSCCVV